ncbi:MAG TPA: SBBP repeat-containing protein [Verrucomicrobiae bacterium]|nr:SBBP repeat-containing protein [Verrucomicrobiae bacterium]
MARHISFSIVCVVACAALGVRGAENPAARSAAVSRLASAPLYFESNAGQIDASAPFVARGNECSVLLAPTEAQILLGKFSDQGTPVVPRSVRLQLVGANPAANIAGRDLMSAKANYFIGNEPSQWHAGVPLFSKVRVDEVYPGVAVIYYANQSAQLEYDFILQPGAASDQIRFHITGADSIRVDASGNLVLKLDSEEIRQHQPVAYQEIRGTRVPVVASYHLNADGTVGFELGQYDRSLPLTIDPVLDFLTYLGGKKLELGHGIALDGSGNIYVAGETLSSDLKTLNPIQFGTTNFAKFRGGNNAFGDAFVAKYDNSGVLQFLTYLGGKNDDGAMGIVYDTVADAVWVTGFTDSTNFPLVNPLRSQLTGQVKNARHVPPSDAFISELDPSGTSLLFSTYFGGNSIDEGFAITADSNGSIYVTGLTSSTNLPVMPPNAVQTNLSGQFDAFVTKLSGSGGVYSNSYTTYYGGTNIDYALGITVDSGFDTWITGITLSADLPLVAPLQLPPGVNHFFTNGYTFTNLNTETFFPKHNLNNLKADAFVAELNPSGTLMPFSSYIGGSNDDVGAQITFDKSSGSIYVVGYTASDNFPTNELTATPTNFSASVTNQIVFNVPNTNFLSHVFVLKITGGGLDRSTAFGGNQGDQGNAIAVDGSGLVYVTGTVGSTNFFERPLLVTNITTSVKHGRTVTNYFGIVTNSPVFTNLSNTNSTVKFRRNGNTNDVFVAVLSSDLSTFVQTIDLGGPGRDEANGIVVDTSGSTVYLVGTTTSFTNFVTTNAAQPLYGGVGKNNNRLSDAFVSKIELVPVP